MQEQTDPSSSNRNYVMQLFSYIEDLMSILLQLSYKPQNAISRLSKWEFLLRMDEEQYLKQLRIKSFLKMNNDTLNELYDKQKNLKQIRKTDEEKHEEMREDDGTQKSSACLSNLDLEFLHLAERSKIDQLLVKIDSLTNEDIKIDLLRSEIINFEEV